MFATLLSSVKGAAATVGTAATGATSGAGGLSALSVASTVVGGLASLYSGAQEASALESQAVDEETRAVQETINGKQDALNALRDLNRDQAKIAVAGYASGIGGEGSVEAAQNEAQKVGEQNISLARENARFQSSARRDQAKQLRYSASGARTGGILGAVRGGTSLFSRRTARG